MQCSGYNRLVKKYLYRLIAFSLSLSIFHSVAAAEEDPKLNEILQKHLDAMGGLYNWNLVESIRLNGTIERDGQTVDIVIVKKRPNQIRATVTVPIPNKDDAYFQVIRAHDGKTAWTATRLAGAPDMVKQELPAEAAAELLADAGVLPPLIKFWREGAQLELISPKVINGVTNYSIRVSGKNLPSGYTFYISGEDHLVTQYESTHPEQGVTQTTLGSYTKAHDVLIPTHNTVQATQTGQSVMTTNSIQIGVGIYEEYFEVGESIGTAEL